MTASAWCPSCGCGWYAEPLPFEVRPPETDCLNPECQCHESFWWSVKGQEASESMTRYMWGDR